MATTSLDSSTTQMAVGSRRGSRQMLQVSCSEMFPQILQNLTRSLTWTTASTSRFMSSGSASRMWNAIRWADLGPMPGRRPSSSISSWTAPSYTGLQSPDRLGRIEAAFLDQAPAQNAFDGGTSHQIRILNSFIVVAGNVLDVAQV